MEALKISDNKRYFVKANGEPFIWIADTVWTLPQRVKWDDVEYLMQKRKAQGFTVLQIVILDPEEDVEMRNPTGESALVNGDLAQRNENYFTYMDWVLKKAEEYGFYVLLLPAWGQLIVGENWLNEQFPKVVTQENAFEYGQFLGERYRQQKNIIWCLGGDRQPFYKGVDYRDVWRRLAEGLAQGALQQELTYDSNEKEWEQLLITYHPCFEMETGECSTMSYWTDDEKWIQFIMVQSGHGLDIKNYDLIAKEYQRARTLPVWDGEPAYEMMPTTWPVIENFHGDWIVRKRGYWSLLAGSFGHTYGHASIWPSVSEKDRSDSRKLTWYEALDSNGAAQMKIMRDFLEAAKLDQYEPAQELVKQPAEITDQHISVSMKINQESIWAYLPSGGKCELDVSGFQNQTFYIWWFNPRDGQFYDAQMNIVVQSRQMQTTDRWVELVAPSAGENEDWLLFLTKNQQELPIRSKNYGEAPKTTVDKKVFDWD